MKYLIPFFVFFVFLSCIQAQPPAKTIMAEFMGVNSNVASYDNKYLADLSKCVKWMREYHDWSHYEAANNYYKWDNITTQPQGYTWPDHTKFMQECRKYGINVLIDVLGKPSWAGTSPIPETSGTGTNAADYLERLEFIGQLVARYGSKKIDATLLETADKATGLNYIKYYEDDNEPDYNWKSPMWPAANYAKYCNAAHDGFGVLTDADHPLLGIKSVDPEAKHVMAGLASADTIYVNNVLKASGGRVPFDVLNVHWYCSDHTNAYSPEHEKYGYETACRNFFKWRNRVLPNTPVWITEFGWDTYSSSNNQHSYTYAPAIQQANYILRSYLVLLKIGFEKSFLFMDTDVDSKNTLQYSASGLLSDKNTKYTRKPSWYYLTTMQNMLGKTEFTKTVAYRELSGNNEIYCFEFTNPENAEKVFALWTRKSGSKTDDGSQTTYQLNPGYQANYPYSVIPADLDADGDTLNLKTTGQNIEVHLTETPQFVVVSGNNTSSEHRFPAKPELKVFPNPAGTLFQISLFVPEKQNLKMVLINPEGKLVKTFIDRICDAGIQNFNFSPHLKPGTYFIRVISKSSNSVCKLILTN